MFKLAGNIEKHFNIVGEEKDAESDTTHVKLVEKHNNIPVYGSDQTVTLDKENNVKAFFGQVIPNLDDKNIPANLQALLRNKQKQLQRQILRKKLVK